MTGPLDLNALTSFWWRVYNSLPPWPRVLMAFLMFMLGAIVVLLNIKNIIVYDVRITDRDASDVATLLVQHNVYTEQSTDENGWTRLILPSEPFQELLNLSSQRSTLSIKRRAETGKKPKEARFEFTTRFLTSRMIDFELSCRFSTDPPRCDLEPARAYQSVKHARSGGGVLDLAVAPAYAAAEDRPVPEEIVPALQTLRRTLPAGGYTEVRLAMQPAVEGYCGQRGRCPDVLYFDVEWNGRRWLFDGTEPVNSRERNVTVSSDGKMGELRFGIENTAFRSGENALKVTTYSRGGRDQPWVVQQPRAGALLDVFSARLELFCTHAERPLFGSNRQLRAALTTVVYKDWIERSHQVIAGSADRDTIETRRKAFDADTDIFVTDARTRTTRWAAKALASPPSVCRNEPGGRWTLLIGVGAEGGRTRSLLAEDEATEMIRAVRLLPRRTLDATGINPSELRARELKTINVPAGR